MLELNKIYNMDCMDGMAQFPDKYFDLAIVDPPYGVLDKQGGRIDSNFKANKWDIKPTPEYFTELFRVSKEVIIWGANNFTLPESEYFIVWDKMQTVDNFASAEYAWTNCKTPARVFRYSIHKVMASRKADFGKIHPTQKPTELYTWLLNNYAKQGYKILDTHLGSASSIIACLQSPLELQYIGFEIDKEYFDLASKRIADYQAQMTIFEVMK